jgi:hypothetical protein
MQFHMFMNGLHVVQQIPRLRSGMIRRGIIAEIPLINIVTTGCTGIFRLRRRMRSDFAQR